MLVLNALPRTQSQKPTAIIRNGQIPAIFYGPAHKPQTLSVNYQEFRKVFRETKRHTCFELDIDGKKTSVLVKDFQRDKVMDTYTHIDFYAVKSDVKVTVPVPVEFVGESPALRVGALLTVTMPYIKVKCLPSLLPSKIDADISGLKTDGDKVRVSDLQHFENVDFIPAGNILVAKAELSRAGKKTVGAEATAAA